MTEPEPNDDEALIIPAGTLKVGDTIRFTATSSGTYATNGPGGLPELIAPGPPVTLADMLLAADIAHDPFTLASSRGAGRVHRWTCSCRTELAVPAPVVEDSDAGAAAAHVHMVEVLLEVVATWLEANPDLSAEYLASLARDQIAPVPAIEGVTA